MSTPLRDLLKRAVEQQEEVNDEPRSHAGAMHLRSAKRLLAAGATEDQVLDLLQELLVLGASARQRERMWPGCRELYDEIAEALPMQLGMFG